MRPVEPLLEDAARRLERDVRATVGPAFAPLAGARVAFARGEGFGLSVEDLVEHVQQELHDTFVSTTWPSCPLHPNHPLWYEGGAWRCATTGQSVAALGELDTITAQGGGR
jgi:hypothetical protein